MKKVLIIAMIFLMVVVLVDSSQAQRARKLPVNAYIKSAKIDILADPPRYDEAEAMLDSLFLWYGPHPEGLYWYAMIMVDFVEKTGTLEGKRPYVEKMMAYIDSLRSACDKNNKEVSKKYKKDCKDFIPTVDSTAVKYWRDFYHDGLDQLKEYQIVQEDMSNETDSTALAFFKDKLKIHEDSCAGYMELALMIDDTLSEPYVVLGQLYQYKQDYKKSIDAYDEALLYTKEEDRYPLYLSQAYSYINLGDYCKAIDPLRIYVDANPQDSSNAKNLTICYNRCEMYDSAYALNKRLLAQSPNNKDYLSSIGRYFFQIAQLANDSANFYKGQANEAKIKEFMDIRNVRFDSARVYFKKVHELQPDDVPAAEEYAVVAAIIGNYDEAIGPFTKLTELQPDNPDHWISLGDCYLNTKNFSEAAKAYEKAVALEPDNRPILERLSDLYKELGNDTRKGEIDKQLKNL